MRRPVLPRWRLEHAVGFARFAEEVTYSMVDLALSETVNRNRAARTLQNFREGIRCLAGQPAPREEIASRYIQRDWDGEYRILAWNRLWSLLVRLTMSQCRQVVAFYHHDWHRRDLPWTSIERDGDWSVDLEDPYRGLSPAEAVALSWLVNAVLEIAPATLRRVAELRLSGRSVRQIADHLRVDPQRVACRLAQLRTVLAEIEEEINHRPPKSAASEACPGSHSAV